MMEIGNSQRLAYLRNLPTGYLVDLLADGEGIDEGAALVVLKERGYTLEEIQHKINRHKHSRLPPRHSLWRMARWASLFNTLVILIFNTVCFYRLLHSENEFRVPLMFLAVLCSGFGFFLGYKMTSHIYQGDPKRLHCGFPTPIGYVNLQTGEELSFDGAPLIIRMAINATVGVTFTLFPLMFIYQVMQ